ncbi:MAG: tetratricopeptide repeat protein [Blastocatellia bacterium]
MIALAGSISNPVGRLYEAIGENDYKEPEKFIVNGIPDKYLSRMLLCMAGSLRLRGDYSGALKLLVEARNLASKWKDSVTLYQAQKEIAIILSIDGDHKSSAEILEQVFPIVLGIRRTKPAHYYDLKKSRRGGYLFRSHGNRVKKELLSGRKAYNQILLAGILLILFPLAGMTP